MAGAETTLKLADGVPLINQCAAAAKAMRKEVIVLCHGGLIARPQDAQYIMDHCPQCDGFYGASAQ